MNQTNINNFDTNAHSTGDTIETSLERYVDMADRRVAEFEQVLSRVIDRLESIGQTLNRIFARGKEQSAHLGELKDKTMDTLAPAIDKVTPALGRGRDMSRQLVGSARENPKPFMMGGALVLGGLFLVAYYMRKHEAAGGFSETLAQPESWRTDNSADFVQNGVANAS